MVVISNDGELSIQASYDSWLKMPDDLDSGQLAYLQMLQDIFRVKDQYGKWIPYKLAPHQVHFHLDDVTLLGENAPQVRVVKKSRNTSFTVSSIISLLMSLSVYKNKIIPVVRLNAQRAADMISDIKDTIRHMQPIELDGQLFPFDPATADMGNALSVKIGECEIRAFPANALASESIRGIRTVGMAGILDESNFMPSFKALFTALRDSSTGATEHQILIGTTLKGITPFSEWLEIQEKNGSDKVKIYDWPIFDRDLFNLYYKDYNLEKPFEDVSELQPLVPWQTIPNLWEKYMQDEHTFKEEYMAMQVDSDEQFYKMMLIMSCIKEGLVIDPSEWTDKLRSKYKHVQVGIDVASVHDYFVITCFGQTIENKWEQFHLFFENKVELNEMEAQCRILMRLLNRVGISWSCGIDANGIGLQMTQTLQSEFGDDKVRAIKGGHIKDGDGNSHKLNEYGHTKLKRLMSKGHISFIDEELLIKHFASWNYEFKCETTESGHGDITMASLYAMLHDDMGTIGDGRLYSSMSGSDERDSRDIWYMREFKKTLKGRNIRRQL